MHEMREMRERNPLSAAEAIGRCLTAILTARPRDAEGLHETAADNGR
jgi:hypothetical protein